MARAQTAYELKGHARGWKVPGLAALLGFAAALACFDTNAQTPAASALTPTPSTIATPPAQSPTPPTATRSTPARTPQPEAPSKSQVLQRLKSLQARQNQIISNIDGMMRRKLGDTLALDLRGQDTKDIDRRLEIVTASLEELSARREEFIARRGFLNQLIFHLDTRWTNEPLEAQLEHRLLDIAIRELTETRLGESTNTSVWKFATYMSIAARELIDPREDVLAFVEGYMNFSTVLAPKSPSQYITSRAYSSGMIGSAAKPVDPARLGDEVEQRLKALQALSRPGNQRPAAGNATEGTSSSSTTSPIEIRVRASELTQTVTSPSPNTNQN